MIDFGFTTIHTLIYSIIFCVFVIFSLSLTPRLWLHRFPPNIRKIVPPRTTTEKKHFIFFAISFFSLFLGYPMMTLLFYGHPVTFFGLFVHFFIIFQFANIIDLLVLDWILFCTITPKLVLMPGTTVNDGYKNYKFHFIAFIKGTCAITVLALVLSGIVSLIN